jgi:hypothetical protein
VSPAGAIAPALSAIGAIAEVSADIAPAVESMVVVSVVVSVLVSSVFLLQEARVTAVATRRSANTFFILIGVIS